LIASAWLASSLSQSCAAAAESARLPDSVTPVAYDIFVEPNIEKGKFTGSERVSVNVANPTTEIVLNAVDLKILEAKCTSTERSPVPLKVKVSYRPQLEQIALQLSHEIQPGRYELAMNFDGVLNQKLRGFYKSSFTDGSGHKRWLATTQMEANDARRMFPCFDEPEYKATFTLTTAIDSDLVAISNSPIAKESTDAKAKRKVVHFQPTPKMSTYLVALVVGPLVASQPTISDGVPIRVWTTPGKEQLGSFSQDLAGKILPFYNNYFGVNYPGQKLDLIAIPDFSAGAMENLGAITFRETDLLVDDKLGSTATKQDVASVVAHEMAHQWFGDLVTMKWWDDLWLNEAFATWMSYKAVDHVRPEWDEWDNFCIERLDSMGSDCLRNTRAIHFAVTDPVQVEQMFDEITYGKGASVLRMLEKFVGEDVFRDGVRRYIRAHQFANATTNDLWRGIGEAAGKDVIEMMHGWVYQPGYPLVTIGMANSRAMVAEQERFLLLKHGDAAFESLWQVPLKFRSLAAGESTTKPGAAESVSDQSDSRSLLTEKQTRIKCDGGVPYLVNAGGDGYYRVCYPMETLHAVAEKMAQLSPLERMNLLSDQFMLALGGDMPIEEYLTLTASYKLENNPNVSDIFIKQLEQLNLLIDDKGRHDFAWFVRDRLGGIKKKLGWTEVSGESDLTKLERGQVLDALGTIGQDKDTIEEARALFKSYVKDRSKVNPDLVETILDIVAYNGNAADYAAIETLFHTAKTPEEEHDALMSLSAFRDHDLIQRTLNMTMTDQVRTQDAPTLVGKIIDTAAGRAQGWQFVMAHWKQMTDRFTEHNLPKIIAGAGSLSTVEECNQLKAFFKANPLPSHPRRIAKTIESVEINVAFKEHTGARLSRWLATGAKGDVATVQ
jgi:puromycin-sensitive aminopeptidase